MSADPARMHFHALSSQAQAQAIRDLAATGQGENTIAHATGLSVEQIRAVLKNGPGRSAARVRSGDHVPTHTGGAGNSLAAAGAPVPGHPPDVVGGISS